MPDVSVVIPVRDGGAQFIGVLKALAAQSIEHELLVCDSGSTDGSVAAARAHGARVLEIAPERFNHGGVRNLLMRTASSAHVALLSQDSEPADAHWLECLLEGFALAEDVALVYGPYVPRPDASLAVRLELQRWFASLSDDGRPSVERLREHERQLPAIGLVGRRGFFTDANACIARAAWLEVPFREVSSAEDRALALEMMRAGYAKAFLPSARVIHSHSYTAVEQLRRCFDEWRGLLEVYRWREPLSPRRLGGQLRGELGQARQAVAAEGRAEGHPAKALAAVLRHFALCRAGALLGSRADRMPGALRARLSLEGRASFLPLELEQRDQRLEAHGR